MWGDSETIVKGLKEVGIAEAINNAQAIYERIENLYGLKRFFCRLYQVFFPEIV